MSYTFSRKRLRDDEAARAFQSVVKRAYQLANALAAMQAFAGSDDEEDEQAQFSSETVLPTAKKAKKSSKSKKKTANSGAEEPKVYPGYPMQCSVCKEYEFKTPHSKAGHLRVCKAKHGIVSAPKRTVRSEKPTKSDVKSVKVDIEQNNAQEEEEEDGEEQEEEEQEEEDDEEEEKEEEDDEEQEEEGDEQEEDAASDDEKEYHREDDEDEEEDEEQSDDQEHEETEQKEVLPTTLSTADQIMEQMAKERHLNQDGEEVLSDAETVGEEEVEDEEA